MKQARNPQTVHEPVGRYVHQIEVSGEGRLLFISGQVGIDANGDVPAQAEKQFEIALRNVLLNVEAAGFEPNDVVKLTTYLVTDIDRAARRAALDNAFGDHVTTSTLIYVSRLAAPEYLVEVEAWASR
ncbi:MAG TPA: RidA family protein [Candidatus Limnocylindrales bacterium]|nr:RidA family protein [Candidatus Limnocylindrales bacterium]